MLKKTTFREIRASLGRYIAILAIVALGVGFFSGLKVTRQAMIETASDYLADSRFYDYQIMSTMGYEKEDVASLSAQPQVSIAEGSVSADILFTTDSSDADRVLKLHSLPEKINTLTLEEGRLPQTDNECVVDYRLFSENPIGKKLRISDTNEQDTLDMLKYKEYTIVGTVVSPIYLNFERGSTSLGNGSVAGFAYITRDGFDTDYFTEIYLKLDHEEMIYSDQYENLLDSTEDQITQTAETASSRRYQEIIDEAKAELADGQAEYDENYQLYLSEKADAQASLSDSYQTLTESEASIKENEKKLTDTEKELSANKESVEEGLAQIAQQRKDFEASKPYMPPEQAAQTEAALNATEKELNENLSQIEAGLAQISSSRSALSDAKEEVASGWQKYADGKAEAEAEFADAEAELADAQKKLSDAKKEIQDIETPDTYVLNRNTNVGYACFENDSNIVDGIAKVFPIFFFLVAALVCMTTMTRMVDEQRTQIGVLKALGYGNGAVISKYLFYSGSGAFAGWAIGFFAGCYIFPNVIWNAYGMMYDFSARLYYIIDYPLAITSLLVSLACSMGATMISCYSDFRETPAQLIRPKAPKDGKRILLERIPFIWNHLSFLYKVSFRNIFRYKKRFFMMVLGISGCTALLVTGLGVRDSIKNVVDYQYDEIEVYDYSIIFDRSMTPTRQDQFLANAEKSGIENLIFLHQGSVDFIDGAEVKSVNLIVSDNQNFDDFIKLTDKDDQSIAYPKKGEAVICRKLAEDFHLSIGDKITLRDSDMKEMEVAVSAICENYVYNYVYLSPDTCKEGWGYTPEIKAAFAHVTGADKENTQSLYQSSAKVMKMDNVTTVSVNNDLRERVANMMKSLDYVIALVILSAGALAFIVLYNLTNINITERIREIATIKVLGFYPKETAAYVFRENIFLTAISALTGLILGKWLHAFVMEQIRVDMLHFDIRITGLSYLLAVILTFVFAIIVNLAMSRKLEKISMTESLKSIE
ncbi:MAG: FtsX-like permease family protein [Emergencia sp.]|nr:FtsX-like permease family protein [Emergencia sp.]